MTWSDVLPLLPTTLVALFGFIGVFYTQKQADKRDKDNAERVDQRYCEDTSRAQRDWARDRKESAYMASLALIGRFYSEVEFVKETDGNLPDGAFPNWSKELYAEVVRIQVFGSPEAALWAQRYARAVYQYTLRGDEWLHTVECAMDRLRRAIQKDLGLVATEVSLFEPAPDENDGSAAQLKD